MVEADPSTPAYRSYLAATFRHLGIAMQKCGQPAEAMRDFRRSINIFEEMTEPTPGDLYDLACNQSLLSGVVGHQRAGREADRAMDTLHRAFAAGWRDAAWMRTDPDLDPIRSRPDFQVLMMDMEFPSDPFDRRE